MAKPTRRPSSSSSSSPSTILLLLATTLTLTTALEQYPIQWCKTYTNVCSAFQMRVACPNPINEVNCEGPTAPVGHLTYANYSGKCECGGLKATRLEQDLIYHEIGSAHAKKSLLVPLATSTTTPPETDFCASFTLTCQAFLDAVGCPASLAVNVGCTTPGDYSTFMNQCLCGSIDASVEARNSIVGYLELGKVEQLAVKEDEYVELCPTFRRLCDSFLGDIACPAAQRVSVGCTNEKENDYETYQGMCQCGTIDVGDRVRRLVIDTYIGPKINMIIDSFVNTDGTTDLCNSFTWSCDQWLNEAIQCPKGMGVNENNCGTASGMEIQDFAGQCTCGDIVAHQRIQDIIIDTLMAEDMPDLLCGNQGACHPVKEIFLVRSNVKGWGVFLILLSFFVVVIASGAYMPKLWTLGKEA